MNKNMFGMICWTVVIAGMCLSLHAQDATYSDPSRKIAEQGASTSEMDASSVKYKNLEQQTDKLKNENRVLETKAKKIEDENSQIKKRINNQRNNVMFLSGIQIFLNPLRFFSPLLANLIYIFGAISLLILLIGWPVVAKKVLSLNYVLNLPKGTKRKDLTLPMSTTTKTIWVIIATLLLVFLMLPAFSQETDTQTPEATIQENVGNSDSEKEEVQESAPDAAADADAEIEEAQAPAPTLSETVVEEMAQAIDFIKLSSLDRAILVLDSVGDGETVRITLEPELLEILMQSARENNHPCIIDTPDPPTSAIKDEFREGSIGYFFMKAALYEAAGKEGVKKLLEEGATPLLKNDGAVLGQLPMLALNAIMQFLGTYKSTDFVKVMIPFATKKARQVDEIAMILELAHSLDLGESYKDVLNIILKEKQKFGLVETLFNLAVKHGRNDAALFILDKAFDSFYYDLEDNLKIVRLINQVESKDKVGEYLNKLAEISGIQEKLTIALTASDLKVSDLPEELLLKTVEMAGQKSDILRILDAADKCNLTSAIIEPIAEKLKENEYNIYFQVQVKGWPEGFGAAFYEVPQIKGYDNPEISLGIWVAILLHLHDKDAVTAGELFEKAIHPQLERIIESLGSLPRLNLNDLYALVQYYSETENAGLETTMKMLAVQRHLRGLSDEKEEVYVKEDARLLALQMELEQQEKQNEVLHDSVHYLTEDNKSLAKEELEINGRFFLLLAEIAAKILLVCIALWVALMRAAAAVKTAKNYRFSHFCLTFAETIGFECCCTIILLVPGMVITLITQDRLKHHHLLEYAMSALPEDKPVENKESPPLAFYEEAQEAEDTKS